MDAQTTVQPDSTVRSISYSRETQEEIRALLGKLTSQPLWMKKYPELEALTDVIEKWDASGVGSESGPPRSPVIPRLG